MIEIFFILALAGVIIFIGFFGNLLFEKTKVPDILILIMLGVIIGPLLTWLRNGQALFASSLLNAVAPYVAALALIIILFDGGLGLNFDRVLGQMKVAVVLTLFAFLLSVISSSIIFYFVFGRDVILCLIMGGILGGTSSAIVIPLVSKLSTSEETKTILALESVLTDVLCVVIVFSLVEIRVGIGSVSPFQSLASAFAIGIVVALIFGIFWLKVLKSLQGKPYSFMMTIAALFVLYGIVEFLKGSGVIAALIFGFVLSNHHEIVRVFKMKVEFIFDDKIRQFQSELSFFVRTFFFVYLGMIFMLPPLGGYEFWIFLIASTLIYVAIMVVRWTVAWYMGQLSPEKKGDRGIFAVMGTRGLAAAVLASLAVTRLSTVSDISSYLELAPSFAFMTILLTCVTATVGTYASERKNHRVKDVKAGDSKDKESAKDVPPPPPDT